MSIKKQLAKIEKMYTSNLDKHGLTSKAVGWNTEDCQILRFNKLTELVKSDKSSFSVNDYGCGYGSLLKFLEDDCNYDIAEYYGYDLSSKMLDAARDNLKDCNAKINLFGKEHINKYADYSFLSGTFNVRFDADDSVWEKFICEKLNELNMYSTKGFAFNLLTSYVDWRKDDLYYGDPCRWFDYCMKHFSKQVALIHDYPLWEWTIIVRKEN